MDKNELNLKIEELKTAMHNRDFEKAVDIADMLDLKKIKDNNFLSLVADAYELSHKYKEAKKVLLLAYENTNAGRHLAYRLCLIAIKNKEYDEAREFYEDFVEMAPRDTARYILKYKMAKAQGKSVDKLIDILEEYVNIDMEEKWAYELAKLYHMAGDEEKCVDMCDEISLWFSEGKYVIKAMELKKMYHPLTSSQQQKYEENKKKSVEEAAKQETEKIEKSLKKFNPKGSESQNKISDGEEDGIQDVSEIKIKPIGEEKFNTMDIQEVIAHGMQEVEIEDEANLHEGAGATKVAPDFAVKAVDKNITDSNEEVEAVLTEKQEESKAVEELKAEKLEEDKEELSEESIKEDKQEKTYGPIETEQIKDVKGVEDILKQLQERGILKAETVQQAVNIIGETEKEKPEENDNISTSERWAQDNKPVETTKNNRGIKLNVVEPPKIKEDEIPAITEEDKKEDTNHDDWQMSMKEEVSGGVVPEELGDIEDLEGLEQILEGQKESSAKKVSEQQEETSAEKVSEKENDAILNRKTGEIPGVPVFDLSFESPQRDSSKDIGQENMYENIVANSDLGNSTDKLPSREEIEEAVKNAEMAMERETEGQDQALEKSDAVSDIHSQKNLSAKVEIISGADWEQPESEEETEHEIDNQPVQADETETADITEEEPQVETKLVLTDDELAEFKNYLNVEGFESNIREVLQDLIVNYTPNGNSADGNVIIMGADKTGKTTLAIEMIKLVNRKRGRRDRKLAKIDAKALNRKGFRNSLNKLLGCDLIVENSQNLGAMTLSEVIDVSGMFTDDMLIILEGETEGMDKILKDSPRVSTVFNHVIRIREYDIKEWVEYGIRYANEQGYAVDELAHLAFYKAIDDFFGKNKGIGKSDVEEIVNQAISKSKRIGRKLSGIFASKKDEEGLNILVESDFNI